MAKEETTDAIVEQRPLSENVPFGVNAPEGPDLSPPPEEKPEPAEDKSQKREWDKDQQKRDQEHANERKVLVAQVKEAQAERRATQTQIDELREAATKPVAEPEDDLLGVDDDYEKLVNVSNTMKKTLQDQKQELAQLRDELTTVVKTQAGTNRVTTEQTMIESLSGEIGAEFQNEAVAVSRAYLKQRGYTADKPASLDTTWLSLRLAYQALAAKATKDKPGESEPSITIDSVTGGGATQENLSEGSLDDIAAAMKQGK